MFVFILEIIAYTIVIPLPSSPTRLKSKTATPKTFEVAEIFISIKPFLKTL